MGIKKLFSSIAPIASISSISSIALILIFSGLAGCNMPSKSGTITPTFNVTQAYQTVEARLTQVAAQTPAATGTPQPTVVGSASETPSAEPATDTPVAPTDTSAPTEVCDQAAPGSPIDVTIPDDTKMQPGQVFTKIWRLRNIGSCTWTKSYRVELFSGEAMGASTNVYLPEDVSPGNSVDISVDMVAPRRAGKYQGNWKLRNPQNQWFGIGPDGTSAFWVRIIVLPTPTLTPTPATPTVTATATPAAQASGQITLIPGDKFDLETGKINSGTGEDLSYATNTEGQHLLVPIGNAVMGVFGKDQPNLADCQSGALGSASFVVEEMDLNDYLCYRTNLGLPGWVRVLDFNRDTYTISLQFLTWALP